jgi:NAD(P)-dependent dehydrogenase (short-subunit alcohol dehydrogenase family)
MASSIALVTGASRGLGLELSRRLSERGWIVLAGARNPAAVPRLQGVEALRLDVLDAASIAAAVQSVRARHGRLDLLVNNAGILLDGDSHILDLDPDRFRQTLECNTLAPLRIAQAFVPLMHRGGRIVNVSSGGGQLSAPAGWAPGYCISKTALNAVTVQLAEALAPRGISVNSICPGWARTDMGGPTAPLSIEEGGRAILWMCLEAPQSSTGGFYKDRARIPW